MKVFFLILLLGFSNLVFADYKIFLSKGFIEIPEEKIEESGFVTKGYTYPDGEFTVLSEDSFELGSLEDSGPNGGVFWKKELSGDFIVSFETNSWDNLNSGLLGFLIERNDNLTRLIEVASYSAYAGGCPFVRWFNPYSYGSKDCNLSATYKFTLTKSNGKFLSVVKNLRTGSTFSQEINADDVPVNVGVYFIYTSSSNYDKKVIKNFTVTEIN